MLWFLVNVQDPKCFHLLSLMTYTWCKCNPQQRCTCLGNCILQTAFAFLPLPFTNPRIKSHSLWLKPARNDACCPPLARAHLCRCLPGALASSAGAAQGLCRGQMYPPASSRAFLPPQSLQTGKNIAAAGDLGSVAYPGARSSFL